MKHTPTATTGERVTIQSGTTIVVRNKAAEVCEKYLKKGDKVYIEGRLKTRKWQDEKGLDRYSTEIQCTEFTFLTPKAEGSTPQQPAAPTDQPTQQPLHSSPSTRGRFALLSSNQPTDFGYRTSQFIIFSP